MPVINYPPDTILLNGDDGVVTAGITHSPDYAYLRALKDWTLPVPDVLVIRVDVVDISRANPEGYDRDDPYYHPDDEPQRYSFELTPEHAVRLAHRLLELAPLASGDLTPREDQR